MFQQFRTIDGNILYLVLDTIAVKNGVTRAQNIMMSNYVTYLVGEKAK